MKVCLVSPEYPPLVGGVGDHTERLASALAHQGIEIIVLTSMPPGMLRHARQSRAGQPAVLRLVSRWGFGLFRQLRGVLSGERPDIVHVQYQTAAYGMHPAICLLPLWLARRRRPVPCVVTLHDLREPYLFPKAGVLRRRTTDLLLRRAGAVITTNGEDAAAVRARAPEAPVLVVPLGPSVEPPASPPDRAAIRRSWCVGPDEFAAGHFGFLNRTKGVDVLFRAAALLRERGLRFRLIMAGDPLGTADPTNAACRAELLALAAQLGLDGSLVWTGPLDAPSLSATLQSLDCCVLPFQDGASYRRSTLITALAHGVPVVTTGPSWAGAELPPLRHRENSLLVPAGDAQALADAVLDLASDSALRARLAAGAHTLAPRFAWPKVASQTMAVYRQALAPPQGAVRL